MSTKNLYPHKPDYAVPPGETLCETIEALGMDQKELAIRTGLDKKTINQIIKGNHPLSQQTAIKLERATGVPARVWNNLETQYQERQARRKDRTRLESELEWLKGVPTGELIKRKVLRGGRDKIRLLEEVLAFFGVSSTTEWRSLWQEGLVCRFRRSAAFDLKPGPTATWMRLGEISAREIRCEPYDKQAFMHALNATRSLTTLPSDVWQPRMVELCAAAGVAVAFVPRIRGCPASGLTRWLTPEKALIQLSLRYKKDDHFWFTFFHEAGHILKGSKKDIIIENGEGDEESERQANEFAANFLIPQQAGNSLQSLRSKSDVQRFADDLGIAPGIVVGRMQNLELIPYSHMNGLKQTLDWAKGR